MFTECFTGSPGLVSRVRGGLHVAFGAGWALNASAAEQAADQTALGVHADTGANANTDAGRALVIAAARKRRSARERESQCGNNRRRADEVLHDITFPVVRARSAHGSCRIREK